MKRLFLSLVALLLAVGLAQAAWNLQQRDDGTATWERTRGTSRYTHDIGTIHLTVSLAAATSGETYLIVPVSQMKLTKLDAVLTGALTGAVDLTVDFFQNDTTGNTPVKISATTSAQMSFDAGLSGGGQVTGTTLSWTVTTDNEFDDGHILRITTGGGQTELGTNTTYVNITATFVPR